MAELGTCASIVDGIGTGGCLSGPFLKMIRGVIPSIESFQFDTLADFNDDTDWLTAIAAREIFPLKMFEEVENTSVAQLTSETSAGTKLFHRNGKYGIRGKMLLTPDQNRILQAYNNKNFRFFLMDDDGTRMGTSPNGTVITGFIANYFRVEPMELPLAADGSQWAIIEIQFTEVDEFNKTPRFSIASDLDWSPKTAIKPLTKITATPGTCATNAFTCAFAYVDPTTGYSVPVRTVVAANLRVKDESGNTEVLVSVVETAVLGTYTITATSMVSGTVELIPSATSLLYSDVTTVAAA